MKGGKRHDGFIIVIRDFYCVIYDGSVFRGCRTYTDNVSISDIGVFVKPPADISPCPEVNTPVSMESFVQYAESSIYAA